MNNYVAIRILCLGAVLGLLSNASWSGVLWGIITAVIAAAYAIHYERRRLASVQR